MSASTKLVSVANLKKTVQENFPMNWVTREFVLQLPDSVPEDEFLFLAKTLDKLVQIETRLKK